MLLVISVSLLETLVSFRIALAFGKSDVFYLQINSGFT